MIRNYNCVHWLPTALDVSINQTCPAVEVLVPGDGSSDNPRAVLAGYHDRAGSICLDNRGQLAFCRYLGWRWPTSGSTSSEPALRWLSQAPTEAFRTCVDRWWGDLSPLFDPTPSSWLLSCHRYVALLPPSKHHPLNRCLVAAGCDAEGVR